MDSSKQDLLFNRASMHSMTIPWSFHTDHHEAPLRDPYGVSFRFDSSSCWDSRYSGRFSYLPFQSHLGLCDYSLEPAFIRKRNERERQRVRCVNEGYARLRQHLPQDLEEKRLSKVETLRAAIGYIKRLQGLLELESLGSAVEETDSLAVTPSYSILRPRRESGLQGHCNTNPSHPPSREQHSSQTP
ncbi:hypothetical protein FKM82_021665 [Ascaphus truei]